MLRSTMVASVIAATAGFGSPLMAQMGGGGAELHMTGLEGPVGLEVDNRARAWLSQMGALVAPGNGSVSWFYVGQKTLNPFIENYPIAINPNNGEGAGVHHVTIDNVGNLLLAVGGPPATPQWGGVIQYSTIPSVAEAGPYPPCTSAPCGAPVMNVFPTGSFALGAGGPDTNVYSVAEDPFGNLFVADAGANMVIKVDTTGTNSVFATFPSIPNPAGGAASESVPTRIIHVPNDGQPGSMAFIMVELTGFPFIAGNSRIWGIANDGTTSVIVTGATTLVDCELDTDGTLLVCSAGSFDLNNGIFSPGTGSIDRVDLTTGAITQVMGGLWLPTGIEVIDGMIYFCTFYEGSMYRFDPTPCVVPCPADLDGNGTVDGADLTLFLGSWGVCP
ncbi:MAG: ScyD/ScyE family protein [Phycisphaerales bacterium]|nr:ScyD/ScyE family protein [Phycisphaerales bacterium]